MSKTSNQQGIDRITTIDDEKKRIVDLYAMRLVAPPVGIFDPPSRCYTLNNEWAKIILGMVANLTTVAAWLEAYEDDYVGITETLKFMQGEDVCCSIEELLSDDEFFNNEYVPQTFGDWYDATTQHNLDLNDAYDGTPQSIGEDIPLGTPDDLEKNALCYAINSFVKLYASGKICILQSRNFLQISWDNLLEASENMYNFVGGLAGLMWLPDLYGCFVSDTDAITALSDNAAIEELACYIYDQLKIVTISQSNFDGAISSAATTLTGNAQQIACIMENDNNLDVYLNFLEAYNIALIRINSGETLECPCETGTYTVYAHEFANGLGLWQFAYSGNNPLGTLTSGRVQGVSGGDVKIIQLRWLPFDMAWRVRAVKLYIERVNGIGNGQDDSTLVYLRPNIGISTGGTTIQGGGFQGNGVQTRCGAVIAGLGYATGGRELFLDLRVTNNATSQIYLDKIEVQFVTDFAYGGYSTDDNNICV